MTGIIHAGWEGVGRQYTRCDNRGENELKEGETILNEFHNRYLWDLPSICPKCKAKHDRFAEYMTYGDKGRLNPEPPK